MKSRVSEVDKAMRKIIQKHPSINLIFDEAPNVIIVPVILTRDCTTRPGYIGKLEYQVSDGFAGTRSNSSDVYSLAEAHEVAVEMQSRIKTLH